MGATLMSDQEILLALEDKVLQIEPLSDEDKILHRKNASIQPSSVDLRIGRILLPDSGGGQKETQVASRWRLEPGNSAVIETRETITLSAQISGFGFPPAHLAAKGLLVTNPGHVDPGFAGTLRLTVINMGRNEILLEEGGEIISLLLFRFEANGLPVHTDYTQRRQPDGLAPRSDWDAVRVLSPDFGNFYKRAEESAVRAAVKALDAKTNYIEWIKWMVPIASIVLGVGASLAVGELAEITEIASETEVDAKFDNVRNELDEALAGVSSKLTQLERQLDLLYNTNDALKLDERFDALERAFEESSD